MIYYVKANGTAPLNKAVTAANSMSVATFAGGGFSPGDTIRFIGEFTGIVPVNDSDITLEGLGAVIHGEGSAIQSLNNDDVTVRNFTLFGDTYGLRLKGDNCLVEGLEVYGLGKFAINAQGNNNVIRHINIPSAKQVGIFTEGDDVHISKVRVHEYGLDAGNYDAINITAGLRFVCEDCIATMNQQKYDTGGAAFDAAKGTSDIAEGVFTRCTAINADKGFTASGSDVQFIDCTSDNAGSSNWYLYHTANVLMDNCTSSRGQVVINYADSQVKLKMLDCLLDGTGKEQALAINRWLCELTQERVTYLTGSVGYIKDIAGSAYLTPEEFLLVNG